MEFAGQQIDYGYMPAAHTDGDLYVHVPKLNLLVVGRSRVGGGVAAARLPERRLAGRPRARARALADLVKPDTRVVPAGGRMMTGNDIVRHRDMYQKLFSTMIGYLNKGLGPEDAVTAQPAQGIPGRVRRPVRVPLRRPAEHDDRLRAGLGLGSGLESVVFARVWHRRTFSRVPTLAGCQTVQKLRIQDLTPDSPNILESIHYLIGCRRGHRPG